MPVVWRGLAATVLAYDPYASAEVAAELQVTLCERDDVIARADFLSLHLPALPETCGMVNADFISKMKKGAYLVNTARGEIVDEAALLAGPGERKDWRALRWMLSLNSLRQQIIPSCGMSGLSPRRTWARIPMALRMRWVGLH